MVLDAPSLNIPNRIFSPLVRVKALVTEDATVRITGIFIFSRKRWLFDLITFTLYHSTVPLTLYLLALYTHGVRKVLRILLPRRAEETCAFHSLKPHPLIFSNRQQQRPQKSRPSSQKYPTQQLLHAHSPLTLSGRLQALLLFLQHLQPASMKWFGVCQRNQRFPWTHLPHALDITRGIECNDFTAHSMESCLCLRLAVLSLDPSPFLITGPTPHS